MSSKSFAAVLFFLLVLQLVHYESVEATHKSCEVDDFPLGVLHRLSCSKALAKVLAFRHILPWYRKNNIYLKPLKPAYKNYPWKDVLYGTSSPPHKE